MLLKKVNAAVCLKITNYSLHMAEIRQNKQKCLIFIVVSWCRKNLIRFEQKEEYWTWKKNQQQQQLRYQHDKNNDINNNNNGNSNINNDVKSNHVNDINNENFF